MQRSTPYNDLLLDKIFSGQDEAAKIDAALYLLNLEKDNFSRIQTVDLKKEALAYKYGRREIEILASAPFPQKETIDTLNRLEQAYHVLLHSPYITEHRSDFSPYSEGLNELRMRSTYDSGTPEEEKEDLLKSVIPIGDVASGVEPKFKAILARDPILYIIRNFPDKEKRWEEIVANKANLRSIYLKFENELPKYVIKLTYKDISSNSTVKPRGEDLSRAHTMKNLQKKLPAFGYDLALEAYKFLKTKHITLLNTEAVLEVLANDVARTFGMEVQSQKLYPGKFHNSVSQLLLLGTWLSDASDLGGKEGGFTAGSPKNEKYLVRPVILPEKGIHHLSDDSIQHLSENLALLYVQGDSDGIGSKVQNKMRRKNKMIGIDFGKAYQANIIKYITPDFQIGDSKLKESFKNYTIFDDVPRSEKIRGIIKLARMRGDISLSAAVLESYGEEFKQAVERLTPHADEMVFEDYIRYFQELKKEYKTGDFGYEENIATCKLIAERTQKTKIEATLARNELVEKFRDYLQVECDVVNLLENIEKVIAGFHGKSSLRSPDNNVLLNHIRMTQNLVTRWDINLLSNRYQLTANLKDRGALKIAQTALKAWLEKSPDTTMISFQLRDNTIQIEFEQNQKIREQVCAIFSEDRIKAAYHSAEYALYKHYKNEQSIVATLESFAQFGIKAWMEASSHWGHPYRIQLERNAKGADSSFFTALSYCDLSIRKENERYSIDIKKIDLSKTGDRLKAIPALAAREKQIEVHLQAFGLLQTRINKSCGLADPRVLKLQRNGLEFTLMVPMTAMLFADIVTRKLTEYSRRNGNFTFTHEQLPAFNQALADALTQHEDIRKNIAAQLEECAHIVSSLKMNVLKEATATIDFSENQGLIAFNIQCDDFLFNELLKTGLESNSFFANDHTYHFSHDRFESFNLSLKTIELLYQENRASLAKQQQALESYLLAARDIIPPSALHLSYQVAEGEFTLSLDQSRLDPDFCTRLKKQLGIEQSSQSHSFSHLLLAKVNDDIEHTISACRQQRARELAERKKLEAKNTEIRRQLDNLNQFNEIMQKDPLIAHSLQCELKSDAENNRLYIGFANRNGHPLLLHMLKEALQGFPTEGDGNYVLPLSSETDILNLKTFNTQLLDAYEAYLKAHETLVENLDTQLKQLDAVLKKLSSELLDRTPFGIIQTAKAALTIFSPVHAGSAKAVKPDIDNILHSERPSSPESLQLLKDLLIKRAKHIKEDLKNADTYTPELNCIAEGQHLIETITELRGRLSPLYVETVPEKAPPLLSPK